jgi:hypothetical protein
VIDNDPVDLKPAVVENKISQVVKQHDDGRGEGKDVLDFLPEFGHGFTAEKIQVLDDLVA